MRYFFLLVFLVSQVLLVGCGQSTYDERLKANVDNPSRMSARNPPAKEEEEESVEDEEWTAEELEAEENAAAADNNN